MVNEQVQPPDIHTTSVEPKTGRNLERYVWKNPISLPEEPYQPRGSEMFPTIIGSQFRTCQGTGSIQLFGLLISDLNRLQLSIGLGNFLVQTDQLLLQL